MQKKQKKKMNPEVLHVDIMTHSHTWTTSVNIPKPRRPKVYNDYKVYYSAFPKETPELKLRNANSRVDNLLLPSSAN